MGALRELIGREKVEMSLSEKEKEFIKRKIADFIGRLACSKRKIAGGKLKLFSSLFQTLHLALRSLLKGTSKSRRQRRFCN